MQTAEPVDDQYEAEDLRAVGHALLTHATNRAVSSPALRAGKR